MAKTYFQSDIYQLTEDGETFDFRLDVTDYDDRFTVEQIDLENGEACNRTPVRAFQTLDEAVAFAATDPQ